MEPLPAPGPTSVRTTGDHYQYLAVWEACVTLLRENAARVPNPVQAVGVEYDGVGNLDDVVLLRGTPPSTYKQVKYTVDSSTPVNEEYLTKPSKDGGTSVLKKIALAWRQLTADGDSADLVLATNRAPDPSDELVAVRDARTGLLMPKAAAGGPASRLGRARTRWAQAAGLTESELGELLSTLRFDLAQDMIRYQESLGLLMAVTGLRHDQRAVEAGADWVAKMVREGRRELTLAMVESAVADLSLEAGPARAVLSIATLKPDPLAPNADHTIDWIDRFDGDSDFDKRRPVAPNTWQQLQSDIEAAPQHLPAGSTAISVTGSFRLAPAFLVGTTFRMVTGTDLAIVQGPQLWSSTDPYDTALIPDVTEHRIDQGDELAVAIAVAMDPTDDVLDYLRDQNLPVSKLLVYAPPSGGAKDKSIPDGSAANALTIGIRDHLRRQTRPVRRLHLFLATPRGMALLLGHRWNRLCQTVVYEDIKVDEGYQPAFTVQA
ncbi:SAVED domain-containing protein [Kitasatospora sp. NBC_00240]|uniref:SAVED domain-containing protein n=1 Tax=Kitasatospora sp. NBC_00240 TaxID=2903567 RepID=UPI0022510679|nr:SAVED domain-containing protein [Kitasatospora sp. NBC_00240]MCX5215605.1 SAVED domain-containing protein [Kitasatospora sp. NBC_00240]